MPMQGRQKRRIDVLIAMPVQLLRVWVCWVRQTSGGMSSRGCVIPLLVKMQFNLFALGVLGLAMKQRCEQ